MGISILFYGDETLKTIFNNELTNVSKKKIVGKRRKIKQSVVKDDWVNMDCIKQRRGYLKRFICMLFVV